MNIFHTYAAKSLKKNRTRTIVTIIGIMLSAAMLTAVTTIISSIRAFGIHYEEALVGDWQVEVDGIRADDWAEFTGDTRIARTYMLSNLGYAELSGGYNEYKPYLCIRGMDESFAENIPLHLTEGRMPERADEVLMPEHVEYNGGVTYSVGDTLTLEVGRRVSADGQELLQDVSFLYMENEDAVPSGEEHEYDAGAGYEGEGSTITPLEGIADAHTQIYTVVGIYERPAFEATSAPGYTVLTVDDGTSGADSADLFLVMKHVWNVNSLYREVVAEYGDHRILYNNSLLRFYGVSSRSDFNFILYGMGSILITIIVIGSVALIYNAFAISIGERTREFGMLASIGATRRQIGQTVRHEALRLCVFGIPLGILAGICGIGVTLSFFADVFEYLIGDAEGVVMHVAVSPGALIVTVAVAVVTVLISVHLPMRRALKVSAVAAIRQNEDIRISKKQLRLPLWARRHFAGDGGNVAHGLALKNFGRNKKSYRATIFSLAMSIVLFVSAGCFSEYLFGSYQNAVDISPYDIQVYLRGEDYEDIRAQMEVARQTGEVAEVYHFYFMWMDVEIPWEDMTEEAQSIWKKPASVQETHSDFVYLNFLPDDIFLELTAYYGLDADKYLDTAQPRAVVFNRVWEEREEYAMLTGSCTRLIGNPASSGQEERPWDILIGDVVDQHVDLTQAFSERFVTMSYNAGEITLIYPESVLGAVLASVEEATGQTRSVASDLFLLAADHAVASEELGQVLDGTAIVMDTAANEEEYRMVRLMVTVFCDGFIILLSLIAAANVFNTISTNLNVRRREFAMLRSLGMTPREFASMLNFECVVYGCRGLLAGLLASLPCAALMYYMGSGRTLEGFYLPVRYPLISAFFVFVLVYVTMCYGRQRMKREQLMDALKL